MGSGTLVLVTIRGPRKLSVGGGAWASVDSVAVLIVPATTMTDADWSTLLSESTDFGKQTGVPQLASLALYGWSISATQRRIANEFIASRGSDMARHAVLTSSALVRGALQALSWLRPSLNLMAYAPSDIASASDWLMPVAPHSRAELQSAVRDCFRLCGASGYIAA
jgi:hypothetical protein